MRTRWIVDSLLVAGVVFAAAGGARADEPNPSTTATDAPAADGRTAAEKAEAARQRGIQHYKNGQWSDALAAFEEAAAASDAPIVQYNIASCQRALGRYVAARRTFRRVLENSEGLASALVDDAKAFAAELDQAVVHVTITLDPAGTPLIVDGRVLRADTVDGKTVFVTLPGPVGAAAPTGKTFTVELDPGVHIFRATRRGHKDAIIHETYIPGENATLDLHLKLLPAHVFVRSEPSQAIVHVDKREVGIAPTDFKRPAGQYVLEVERDNFVTYTATLDLQPGERADLTAKLVPEPITKKKWFVPVVVGSVLAVGGAIVAITVAATRPEPDPPPYDGGSTGWVLHPSALRW